MTKKNFRLSNLSAYSSNKSDSLQPSTTPWCKGTPYRSSQMSSPKVQWTSGLSKIKISLTSVFANRILHIVPQICRITLYIPYDYPTINQECFQTERQWVDEKYIKLQLHHQPSGKYCWGLDEHDGAYAIQLAMEMAPSVFRPQSKYLHSSQKEGNTI